MTEKSDLEKNVMRRVHRIRVLRLIISGAVFALTATLLALYGIGREVWVARVFENGPQDARGQLLYFIYAFEHTRFAKKGPTCSPLFYSWIHALTHKR